MRPCGASSTAYTERRAPSTTGRREWAAPPSCRARARRRARWRCRGARRPRGPRRADLRTTSPRAHELAEALADETVEVDRQLPVRARELTQVHEEKGALLVADR